MDSKGEIHESTVLGPVLDPNRVDFSEIKDDFSRANAEAQLSQACKAINEGSRFGILVYDPDDLSNASVVLSNNGNSMQPYLSIPMEEMETAAGIGHGPLPSPDWSTRWPQFAGIFVPTSPSEADLYLASAQCTAALNPTPQSPELPNPADTIMTKTLDDMNQTDHRKDNQGLIGNDLKTVVH